MLITLPSRNMIITEKASKAEILSNACEMIDGQTAEITELKQKLTVLWVALGLTLAAMML